MKTTVFWNVCMPYSLANWHRFFWRKLPKSSEQKSLNVETTGSSETLVHLHQTMQRHNPHIHRRENLKPHMSD
jgi:hypothetical protein